MAMKHINLEHGLKRVFYVTTLTNLEPLRYKSEDRGFNSRCRHWNFSLT